MSKVRVVPCDDRWPSIFEGIASRLSAALGGLEEMIEHVGSTSVPGLTAKPVIDVSVVLSHEVLSHETDMATSTARPISLFRY